MFGEPLFATDPLKSTEEAAPEVAAPSAPAA
jgi:hypothetical protein